MHAPFRFTNPHYKRPIHFSSFTKPINQSGEHQPRLNMAINYPTATWAMASLVFMVLITSPHEVLSRRALLDTSATGKAEVGLTRLPRSPPPAPRANDNPIEPPPRQEEMGVTKLPRSPPPAPKANDNPIEPPRNEEVGLTRLPRRSPPAPKANTPIFSPPRTLLP